MKEGPKRKGGFLGFIKNFLVFLLLIGIIAASFWVSFLLGKRILVPVKKIPEQRIDIVIPEPPPSIAAMQRLEEVMEEEQKKAESSRAAVPEAKPKIATKPIVSRKTSPSRSVKHYYKVQAGFFSNKNNALELAKKLNASGFETYIKKVSKGWRVQVGAFARKAQALNLQKALSAKGFESTLIYE